MTVAQYSAKKKSKSKFFFSRSKSEQDFYSPQNNHFAISILVTMTEHSILFLFYLPSFANLNTGEGCLLSKLAKGVST